MVQFRINTVRSTIEGLRKNPWRFCHRIDSRVVSQSNAGTRG